MRVHHGRIQHCSTVQVPDGLLSTSFELAAKQALPLPL